MKYQTGNKLQCLHLRNELLAGYSVLLGSNPQSPHGFATKRIS